MSIGKTFLVTFAILTWVTFPSQQTTADEVTFSDHIAKIVYAKCSSCHRPGQSGPFSLLTYSDVANRADTIQAVIDDGYMPPWKNVTSDVQFDHDRRLTKKEIELINRWVDDGAPQGNPKTAPPQPKFPTDWQLGKPDLVVEMNGSFTVPASGPDLYRSFVFAMDLPNDRWIKAIEIKPQAKSTLHHALFFLDTAKAGRAEDGKDGRPGISGMRFLGRNAFTGMSANNKNSAKPSLLLGGYVPGTTPMLLPGDHAMLLPKGSDLVMQTHFHPSGKKEVEHATMALYFAEKPPSRQLTSIMIPPLFGRFANIDIPAEKKDYTITDSFKLSVGVNAIRTSGHAHYLGKEMSMVAKLPDGKTINLFQIDDWDLDWQDTYQFAEPVRLPAGTILESKIVYDNSSANPSNPHSPPKRVKWGRESNDEMGNVTLQVVAQQASDQAKLNESVRGKVRQSMIGAAQRERSRPKNDEPDESSAQALIKQMDANKDGRIQLAEFKKQFPRAERLFNRFDKNSDGELDKSESDAARKQMKQFPNLRSRMRGFREDDQAEKLDRENAQDQAVDIAGQRHQLFAGTSDRYRVITFVTTDCPIANAYQPTLRKLAEDFSDAKVDFFQVNPTRSATVEKAKLHASEFEIASPMILDPDQAIVGRLGAKVTPETFLISPAGDVIYRGRIDDLYVGFGKKRQKPTVHNLRDSIKSALASRPIATPATKPVGCIIQHSQRN